MKRYSPIPITKSPDGNQMYKTTRYPEVPRTQEDTYVYTTIGDRFDTLAQQYYGDSTLWWIISSANPQIKPNSLYPTTGIQLRIPANTSNIISSYKVLNQ